MLFSDKAFSGWQVGPISMILLKTVKSLNVASFSRKRNFDAIKKSFFLNFQGTEGVGSNGCLRQENAKVLLEIIATMQLQLKLENKKTTIGLCE